MPNIPTSFNDRTIFQPQLIRWRSRYRGVRESQKINLEMQQIRYDLLKLEDLADNTGTSLNTQSSSIEFECNLSVLNYNGSNFATQQAATQDIISRLQKLIYYSSLLASNYWSNNA